MNIVQELCLSIIPNVGKLVDRDSMKIHLLPKLLRLATEGGVLSVRFQFFHQRFFNYRCKNVFIFVHV